MKRSFHTSKSHPVILAAGVRAEEAVLVLGGLGGDLGPLRGGEGLGHPGVEGEHAGGGAQLSAHVADRSHICIIMIIMMYEGRKFKNRQSR